MGAVRGVVLDESVLLAGDGDVKPCLLPGVEAVLRKLQYSRLRVAFFSDGNISADKTLLLNRTAGMYSWSYVSFQGVDLSCQLNKLLKEWNITEETCFYVTSRKEALFHEIQNQSWMIVCVGMDTGSTNNKQVLFINKLEELFITICSSSKKAMTGTPVAIIGYVMKPSRVEDFAKRGAFPMYPTENGLIFVPLLLDTPLTSQVQEVDAILHKATDEILNINPQFSTDFSKGITFSKGMLELERFIQDHPDYCMIDPLKKIYPLLDRQKIQEVLLQVQHCNVTNTCRLRAPHFLKVDNFNEPNLRDQLSEAKLSFPLIVKPRVACGVADAHNMALVFKLEDFTGLSVPLPAILQEYVDHGSCIFKFYVLGNNVFHAVKKSMPDSSFLLSLSEKAGSKPIMFNSLKSLPVATEDPSSVGGLNSNKKSLDVELVKSAANWLQKQLDLTIFGFDVVIQEGSGDHVIVDLNYLPSFKEVPDVDAIPAFWNAIRRVYEMKKANCAISSLGCTST